MKRTDTNSASDYTYRLNHFILWCKGWYIPTDEHIDLFEQAVIALKLDGYTYASKEDVIGVVLNYIDYIVDSDIFNGRPNYLKMHVWNQNICRMMHIYDITYDNAVLMVLCNFFRYHIDKTNIILTPPEYSRKLYKMGFKAPSEYGNSYKMTNHKITNFFNRANIKRINSKRNGKD